MTDVFIKVPLVQAKEGSSFSATAYFRSSAGAAEASSTAKYRIDNLTTRQELADWTSLTPAASIAIPITATHNAIQNNGNRTEKIQLTVAADPDTSTATIDTAIWEVLNVYGYT